MTVLISSKHELSFRKKEPQRSIAQYEFTALPPLTISQSEISSSNDMDLSFTNNVLPKLNKQKIKDFMNSILMVDVLHNKPDQTYRSILLKI